MQFCRVTVVSKFPQLVKTRTQTVLHMFKTTDINSFHAFIVSRKSFPALNSGCHDAVRRLEQEQ